MVVEHDNHDSFGLVSDTMGERKKRIACLTQSSPGSPMFSGCRNADRARGGLAPKFRAGENRDNITPDTAQSGSGEGEPR